MKKPWRVVGLVFSHLVVGTLVFAMVVGTRTRTRVRPYVDDPMYRIGLQLSGVGPDGLTEASFNKDLETVSRRFPAPTADVIRLMKFLKDAANENAPSFAEAGRQCRALSWQKCDQQDLLQMKKALAR